MAVLDFPTSPSTGDLWPPPPAAPRWMFDGTRWISAPSTPPPDQGVTGDLTVGNDLAVGGDVAVTGGLDVTGQVTFADGVDIDGEPAATETWVNTKIDDIKNLGFFAGSFPTHAALPTNLTAIPQLTLNDFVTVVADETHSGATTRYIATAINPGTGDITWTYDITYSTDVTGKMDKVPAAIAGHVAIFDNAGQVEDAGSDLQAATLQFRAMTPNIRNWIPLGVEGVFVGEGTNILNAPTSGTWRYLAFAKASGALNLIAFEDNGGPMRATRTAQGTQRVARTKRNGGVANATDGWSWNSGGAGLTIGWGEYQRPMFSSESSSNSIGGDNRGGNMMKVSGRNLLERVPGGNIQIGPRHSTNSPYRNPYNMNIDHRRLVFTGASGTVNMGKLHMMKNIWQLENHAQPGYVMHYNTSRTLVAPTPTIPPNPNMMINVSLQRYMRHNNRPILRYKFAGYTGVRTPFAVVLNITQALYGGSWVGQNYSDRRAWGVRVILDMQALGGNYQWVDWSGRSNAINRTVMEGMGFMVNGNKRDGTIFTQFVANKESTASSSNPPNNTMYVVDIDFVPRSGKLLATINSYEKIIWPGSRGPPC